MLRLVAYAAEGPQRFTLGAGKILLGRDPGCDIQLDHPDVAPLHATLTRSGNGLQVKTVEAARVLINGSESTEGLIEPFDELTVAGHTLVLEDTDLQLQESATEPGRIVGDLRQEVFPDDPALGIAMARQRLLEHLSSLSSWVLSDASSNRSLEAVLAALNEDFGGGATYLFEGRPESETSVKLVVTRNDVWVGLAEDVLVACRKHAMLGPGRTLGHFNTEIEGEQWLICFRAVKALDRDYFGAIVIPPFPFEGWTPELGFATVTDLIVLGLVHHVGRYEPILPGRGEQRDLTLAPGMVVGPSPRMERLIADMQAVADTRSNVMILGEVGSGRELVARSLHSSGPQRSGPFVVFDCASAEVAQLTADLFGAEVQGKTAPVRREGKAQLAADGTLFLRSVDQLPIVLQGRLISALRTGVVHGPAIGEQREVEFRVMATSDSGSLSGLKKRGYRIDLANSLCQLLVEVPPLRDRIEDLPLLLQTLVNRFSHETGRRVRGITTRALKALSTYDFPGNLKELENTVRQMIFLSRSEGPLDLDLLPAPIRNARVVSRADSGLVSVAGLAELVSRVERQAIRDAIEKSKGNKAKAARTLGISRNGLAQKMRRYKL